MAQETTTEEHYIRVDGDYFKLVDAPEGLPSEIVLLHQTYLIFYVDNLTSVRNALGLSVFSDRMILIDTNQAHDSRVEVLAHEIIHCWCDLTGLRGWLGEEAEEHLVSVLAPMWLDTERGNNLAWFRG